MQETTKAMRLFKTQPKESNQFSDAEMRLLLSLVTTRMLKNVSGERTFQSLGKLKRKLTNLINK